MLPLSMFRDQKLVNPERFVAGITHFPAEIESFKAM